MRRFVRLLIAAGLAVSMTGSAFAGSCNVPICKEQGGARMTVGDGGSLDVESGGELDVESGGELKIAGTAVTASAAELNALAGTGLSAAELGTLNGVDATLTSSELDILDGVTKTAAQINALTIGVAAGYKVARGETALDGSNPTTAATGLTTIVACVVSLKGTAAPGVGTSVLTYDWTLANLDLYGWKVTGVGDTTLIASTGTETVGWVCIGT